MKEYWPSANIDQDMLFACFSLHYTLYILYCIQVLDWVYNVTFPKSSLFIYFHFFFSLHILYFDEILPKFENRSGNILFAYFWLLYIFCILFIFQTGHNMSHSRLLIYVTRVTISSIVHISFGSLMSLVNLIIPLSKSIILLPMHHFTNKVGFDT